MTRSAEAPYGGSGAGLSVAGALSQGRALGLDRIDCALLLGHVLGRSRTWLIANDGALLSARETTAWRGASQRRLAGEPVAYILGTKEFHGLELAVTPAVLVPRPETEQLVQLSVARCRARGDPSPRIIDLGTGSGAIALAIKTEWSGADVLGSDASSAALEVARANAIRLGLDVTFRLGSWWQPWRGERFDVVVCNPPYVAEGDPHLQALRHEPRAALVADGDGLAALRAVVQDAPGHLRSGGSIWLEHGFEQQDAVAAFLEDAGFSRIERHCDLAGRPRCTGGILGASRHPLTFRAPRPPERVEIEPGNRKLRGLRDDYHTQ